jgi:hypothetical protein
MKISPWTIFVWCVAISMITITYGLAKRQPILKTVDNYVKYREDEKQEQLKWKQVANKVTNSINLGQSTVQKWNQIAQAQTLPPAPDPLGIDLSVDQETLLKRIMDYRNSLQQAVNNQVKAGGVTVIQGPVVPLPPLEGDKIVSDYFHYPAKPAPVLVFDLGQVTVQGTYQQISDNIRAWSRMPHFLAVADGLTLQGTSPKLTANYAVSIVGFVAMPAGKQIFPALPEGSRLISAGVPAAGQAPAPAPGGKTGAQGRAAPGVPGRGRGGA